VLALLLTFGLFKLVPRELAPNEDRGSFSVNVTGPEGAGFDYYAVRMIPLDSLKLDGVGLVKIDIQGAEALALRGAEETLRRCNPVVLIEEKPYDERSTEQTELCRKILLSYGYREGEKVGADRIYVCD